MSRPAELLEEAVEWPLALDSQWDQCLCGNEVKKCTSCAAESELFCCRLCGIHGTHEQLRPHIRANHLALMVTSSSALVRARVGVTEEDEWECECGFVAFSWPFKMQRHYRDHLTYTYREKVDGVLGRHTDCNVCGRTGMVYEETYPHRHLVRVPRRCEEGDDSCDPLAPDLTEVNSTAQTAQINADATAGRSADNAAAAVQQGLTEELYTIAHTTQNARTTSTTRGDDNAAQQQRSSPAREHSHIVICQTPGSCCNKLVPDTFHLTSAHIRPCELRNAVASGITDKHGHWTRLQHVLEERRVEYCDLIFTTSEFPYTELCRRAILASAPSEDSPFSYDNLPSDAWGLVFRYFDFATVARMRRVSTHTRAVAESFLPGLGHFVGESRTAALNIAIRNIAPLPTGAYVRPNSWW